MDLERDGNLIEAGVWFVFASVLFFYAFRREKGLRSVASRKFDRQFAERSFSFAA
jgi:hypothetical protein